MTQFKKITDKLYECLAEDGGCKFRVPFGLKTFCSWLLRGEESHHKDNFPCNTKIKGEKSD